MFKGFNLNVADDCFTDYKADGLSAYQEQKASVLSSINSLKNADGTLNASKITAKWFPAIKSDVFISHSRKDSDLSIRLAGFLRYEFGLSSFIDSAAWGYADDLLKLLDNEYCWQEHNETYNYRLRNRSTSHVHMMLTTALTKMIDACECIIFINTPSSILPDEYISGQTTDSPWIYIELAMSSLVQRRLPSEHRELALDEIKKVEAMRVKYDVDLSHLTSLSTTELSTWRDTVTGVKGPKSLDFLYGLN